MSCGCSNIHQSVTRWHEKTDGIGYQPMGVVYALGKHLPVVRYVLPCSFALRRAPSWSSAGPEGDLIKLDQVHCLDQGPTILGVD